MLKNPAEYSVCITLRSVFKNKVVPVFSLSSQNVVYPAPEEAVLPSRENRSKLRQLCINCSCTYIGEICLVCTQNIEFKDALASDRRKRSASPLTQEPPNIFSKLLAEEESIPNDEKGQPTLEEVRNFNAWFSQ